MSLSRLWEEIGAGFSLLLFAFLFIIFFGLKILLIVGGIILLLFLLFKKKSIFRSAGKSNHKQNNGISKSNFVKSYLVWFIAFIVGLIIANYLLPNINFILSIVIAGIILECCSKIMQVLVFNHKWKFDKHFLFWIIVQIILLLLSSFIAKKLELLLMPHSFAITIDNYIKISMYLRLVLMGILQTIFVHVIWKSDLENKILK